jgi:hypothetical protein
MVYLSRNAILFTGSSYNIFFAKAKKPELLYFLVIPIGLLIRYIFHNFDLIQNLGSFTFLAIYFDLFLIGVLGNFLVKYVSKFSFKLKHFMILIGTFTLVSNTYLYLYNNLAIRFFVFAIPTFTALFTLFLIVFSEKNNTHKSKVSFLQGFKSPINFAQYLGFISFSFYLVHGEVAGNINRYLPTDTWTHYILKVILSFVISFTVSVFTNIFIEQRFMQKTYLSKALFKNQ